MTHTPEKTPGRLALWRTLIKLAVLGVVLALVTVALVDQFKRVPWGQVRFDPIPATGAIVCLLGVSVMQLIARWTLLSAYGYPLNWRIQLPVSWIPQLGKYVPGGVASVAGAVYLMRRFGVPGAVALGVSMLLDGLAVIAGLIISTPLLLSGPVRQRWPGAWIVAAVFVACATVLLHPRVFVSTANAILRKLRRNTIPATPTMARYVAPVAASFGQWLFAGAALWLMTLSVIDVPATLLPLFIGSAALAMTVSYLAPFAPGGIGVREGLYLVTLGPTVGPATAIVVVAMRVVQTIIELVLAGVGMIVLREPGVASPCHEDQPLRATNTN